MGKLLMPGDKVVIHAPGTAWHKTAAEIRGFGVNRKRGEDIRGFYVHIPGNGGRQPFFAVEELIPVSAVDLLGKLADD